MKTKNKRVLITVQLNDGEKPIMQQYAKRKGLKLSDVVRQAIRSFLGL